MAKRAWAGRDMKSFTWAISSVAKQPFPAVSERMAASSTRAAMRFETPAALAARSPNASSSLLDDGRSDLPPGEAPTKVLLRQKSLPRAAKLDHGVCEVFVIHGQMNAGTPSKFQAERFERKGDDLAGPSSGIRET